MPKVIFDEPISNNALSIDFFDDEAKTMVLTTENDFFCYNKEFKQILHCKHGMLLFDEDKITPLGNYKIAYYIDSKVIVVDLVTKQNLFSMQRDDGGLINELIYDSTNNTLIIISGFYDKTTFDIVSLKNLKMTSNVIQLERCYVS